MATFDPSNYSLTLLRRENLRPWSWAIRKAGNKHPIQRSTRSFATEGEASQDGNEALAALLQVLLVQHETRTRNRV
jgi:hypothetical protein